MGVAFKPGYVLVRGDLDLYLSNSQGNVSNAADIYYALYYVDPGPPEAEVLIGSDHRIPVNPAVGEYYASMMVTPSATVGDYRIRWTFKDLLTSPYQQVVQEFAVVQDGVVVVPGYSAAQRQMIDKLRLLLRDDRPDQNYHFRPPEYEGDTGRYNRVFGQIWRDDELLEYCVNGLDAYNEKPPFTGNIMTSLDVLVSDRPSWRTAVLWAAITHACFALAINWVADEFDYSIGGVSLTLDKSSKYESLKQNAEAMFDKSTEAKVRTVKFIRGLVQPRFGLGVRSAFGPNLGRGILSPRGFLVVPVFLCAYPVLHVLSLLS